MSLLLGAKITSATGGTISSITGYTVHTFTSSGTFTPNGSGPIEVLLVGGGGGAGANIPADNGGGGGGATLYQKFVPVISGVAYTMTIGTGGLVGALPTTGSPGGITTCTYNGGTISVAGGGGGGRSTNNPGAFAPLASGGGGAIFGGGGAGANIIGLGFNGQVGHPNGGGSGGGAGSLATFGIPGSSIAGIGVSYSITGSSVYYGGGGCAGGGGSIHPTSFSTLFGLGGSSNPGSFPVSGLPGVIIIRYPS